MDENNPKHWLRLFDKALKTEDKIEELVFNLVCLVGPTPLDEGEGWEKDHFTKYGITQRWFNRRVCQIIKTNRKMDDLRIGLTNDMCTQTDVPGYGEIAEKKYAERLVREFLIDQPTEDWV